jgi:hypothetical protein
MEWLSRMQQTQFFSCSSEAKLAILNAMLAAVSKISQVEEYVLMRMNLTIWR